MNEQQADHCILIAYGRPGVIASVVQGSHSWFLTLVFEDSMEVWKYPKAKVEDYTARAHAMLCEGFPEEMK